MRRAAGLCAAAAAAGAAPAAGAGGLYEVTVLHQGIPVLLGLDVVDPHTGNATQQGTIQQEAIGQATAGIDGANGLLYIKSTRINADRTAVDERVVALGLRDARQRAEYFLPQIPYVKWDGFAQVFDFDATAQRALTLAPGADNGVGPFPFSLYATDVAANTTRVFPLGDGFPISEGSPSAADPTRGLFWFILGTPCCYGTSVRQLVAVDTATGEVKANRTLAGEYGLSLFAWDSKTADLWGLGFGPTTPPPASPLLGAPRFAAGRGGAAGGAGAWLLRIDGGSGDVVQAWHVADGTFGAALPGVVALDAAARRLYAPVTRIGAADPTPAGRVDLAVVDLDSAEMTVTKGFCTASTHTFTCPKALKAGDAAGK